LTTPPPLRDYQAEANAEVIENLRKNKDGTEERMKKGVLVMPTGCHALGQLIMMHDGSLRPVQDIVVGDFLMGDESNAVRVDSLIRGRGKMYVVRYEDRTFVVNEAHVMCLLVHWTDNPIDIPLGLLLQWPEIIRKESYLYDINGDLYPFDVQEVGDGDFYGFSLEGNGRYAIEGGIINHNSGKTRCGTDLAYRAIRQGKRVLWVAHRDELISQAAKRAKQDGIPEVGIIAASFPNPHPSAPMQVASVGTLLARKAFPPADLVILDECFVAGTKIDGVPIESVREGDMVWSVDHVTGNRERKPVVRVFRGSSRFTVQVSVRGKKLYCTPGHPFFVRGRGYVRACLLREGDELVFENSSNLLHLLGEVPSEAQELEGHAPVLRGELRGHIERKKKEEVDVPDVRPRVRPSYTEGPREAQDGETVLLGSLPGRGPKREALGDHGIDEQKVCVRSDEKEKSDDEPRHESEGESDSLRDRPSSSLVRREGEGNDGAAEDAPGGAGGRMGAGVLRSRGKADPREAEQLLHRHRQHQDKAGGGGGWNESRNGGLEKEGQGEDGFLEWARVEGVEVFELGDNFGPEERGEGRDVFNLEVEGNHNYFAEGVLVHNCHHYAADHWSKTIDRYSSNTVIGLTATPERSSGAPLGDFFDFLVHGPQPADLIAAGHLVPCEVVGPNKALRGGIAWDPLEAWLRFAGGRRTVAFCATTQQSKDLRDRFASQNIPAAHIDMNTKPERRSQILADLAAGHIRVVTNVYVLTEGTDIPPVEVCLIARPLGSAAMFIQAGGRSLRPSPATGKKKALLIDLPGCVYRFGTLDVERIYSLHGDHGVITSGGNIANLKCKGCGLLMPKDDHGACIGCGHTAPPGEARGETKIKDVDIDFVRQLKSDAPLVEAYARLVVLARQKNYKPAFAAKRFHEMYGQWPEANWLPWLETRIFPLFPGDALPSSFTRVLLSAISEIAA
jgi:superfamily II DNA or RNA helicase